MYPLHLFSLFPPFPRENKVFVAMSFDGQFDNRWENVISPAIRNMSLNPYRVDTRVVSDSILTDIIQGISNSELILADVTTIDMVEGKAIRNGNVMYEVGLAHAVRLPEEVILFRSDKDSLLFDVKDIRVNYYEPDTDPSAAMLEVGIKIKDSLLERDLKKNIAVKKACETIDFTCYKIMMDAIGSDGIISHPVIRTMRDVMGNASRIPAINRLLELGIINTKYRKFTFEEIKGTLPDSAAEELVNYKLKKFGEAVFFAVAAKHGIDQKMAKNII